MMFVVLFSVSAVQCQSIYPGQTSTKTAPGVLPLVSRLKEMRLVSHNALQPPTDTFCRVNLGYTCYSPQEIQKAYGLTPLLQAGFNGTGQTIVIIDSFGSPTIAQDLQTFDAGFGLPDPPSFTVLAPLGTVPFDPTNEWQVAWAGETTMDVEIAHAMAPGANIVLMTSPVSQTEGIQGLPKFLYLEKYALQHKLGNIISQSWVATENTLFDAAGQKVLNDFEDFYQEAAKENVTILAGTGDSGTANLDATLKNFYSFPTVNFPASSPYVTAVGGTSLYVDTSGNYQYEVAWGSPYVGASGGGVSQQFAEPSYQYSLPASVQTTLNNYRGIPDVASYADGFTSPLIYASFMGPQNAGYAPGSGTSEGSPQWAGIIADVNQLAGHPLGFLNPKLYAMGERFGFFHDITFGSNSFVGLQGYLATPGWDFVTGWGTPDLSNLAWELAKP